MKSELSQIFGIFLDKSGKTSREVAIESGVDSSTISRIKSGDRGISKHNETLPKLAKGLGLKSDETDLLYVAMDILPPNLRDLELNQVREKMKQLREELSEMIKAGTKAVGISTKQVETSGIFDGYFE
jgi:transcriptional regulator with XRE-family HTH domain